MVTTTTTEGRRVAICTCTRTGCHLATFTCWPGQVAAPCSCRLLSHQTLLWHHHLGHPSLPRLSGMHSRLLVSVRLQLREDLPVLRLHSDRGGEFSSDLLRDFCRGEGILQSFTLLASLQQNGVAERRIGLVMEVAHTSMIHAAAPHFLWPFVVRYAAHQLTLWPRVSLTETSPTLRWTGKVGDAAVFRDITFDESDPFYRLFPYRTALLPPPPLFLAPGPPPVDPLPPQGPAPSGVSQVDPLPLAEPFKVTVDSGAAGGAACGGAEPAGAELGGAEPEGAEPRGAETEGAEPWGAESEGAESGGAEPRGTASAGGPAGTSPRHSRRREPLSPWQLREWFARRSRLRSGGARAGGPTAGGTGAGGAGATSLADAGVTAGAGGTGGTGAAGPGGARTRGTGAGGAGAGGTGAGVPGAEGTGAGDPGAGGASAGGAGVARGGGARGGGTRAGGAGAGGASAGGARAGAGGTGAGGAGAGDPGAGGAGAGGAGAGDTGAGGTVQRRPFFVPPPPPSLSPPGLVLRQVLSLLSSTGLTPRLLCPSPHQSQPQLQTDSPLPAPSPYGEQTYSLTERHEPESRPALRVCTGRRVPRLRPPPVPGTHIMAFRPSSVPLRSVAASALVAALVDFAAACRLDYAVSLVAESECDCPPSVKGECALGTDVLEDRQEDFECLAADVPHLLAMLLAPEGDPDAPDIPTPRSDTEAITGPYSYQWQTSIDAEMASWKSTGTDIDAVPPPRANIVDGRWIFRVKQSPGSPHAWYVAQGFSQRQGVDFFQTFSPTPKMTTLWVLLHVDAQHDYELHSLDFSTDFLQGSLHEEFWLRRPPGVSGVARHTEDDACASWVSSF
ncbi:unnamed protein product [Closterium sp. NIES-54]